MHGVPRPTSRTCDEIGFGPWPAQRLFRRTAVFGFRRNRISSLVHERSRITSGQGASLWTHRWHPHGRVILRRTAPLLVLLTLSTCDADATDDAGCEESNEPASLTIDNRTGGVVESVTATPCEGDEEQELSLPDAGIPFSEKFTVELPAPGCWLLRWNGSGCTNDPPHRTTTDVCGGSSYEWTTTIDGRVCDGGW